MVDKKYLLQLDLKIKEFDSKITEVLESNLPTIDYDQLVNELESISSYIFHYFNASILLGEYYNPDSLNLLEAFGNKVTDIRTKWITAKQVLDNWYSEVEVIHDAPSGETNELNSQESSDSPDETISGEVIYGTDLKLYSLIPLLLANLDKYIVHYLSLISKIRQRVIIAIAMSHFCNAK